MSAGPSERERHNKPLFVTVAVLLCLIPFTQTWLIWQQLAGRTAPLVGLLALALALPLVATQRLVARATRLEREQP